MWGEAQKRARKNYRKKHRAKLNRQRRLKYALNKENVLRVNKEWKQRNPEKVKAHSREWMRRKRTKEAIKFIQKKQIERRYKPRRKELNKTRDHKKSRAAAKRWRDANPEKVRAIERRKYLKRKAKKCDIQRKLDGTRIIGNGKKKLS